SRFLVLVLSPRTVGRAWVTQEGPAFLARHGPLGHIGPVMLETVEVPPIHGSIQSLNALAQDAERVARELAAVVGRPGELDDQDPRRLLLGQHLSFVLELTDDGLGVTGPDGRRREVTPPWRGENAARFTAARLGFGQLTRKAIESPDDHAELVGCATTLGELLFAVLFDEEDVARLGQATVPGYSQPLVTIRSDDDVLLSLPWELLCHQGSFLVRDGRVDLARS
ncbi:MAG: hypothetical protein GY867_00170, partial [bacterium]|nr:hypothetical protein [bacterium]